MIISHKKRNGQITYNQVKQYFKKLYKRLNITGLNLHSFRHTFGCMCYHVGMPAKKIQRIMGHSSIEVTMNIYVEILGAGNSPFIEYFKKYKEDEENKPPNYWKIKYV